MTLDFEIQEAITFRDGAAQAIGDLESVLVQRDAAATARIDAILGELGQDLGAGARGESVADPDDVEARAERGARAGGQRSSRRSGRTRAPPTSTSSGRRSIASQARSRPGSSRRPSRPGSRRTRSSSSAPSSACAGSRRTCSSAPRACSGTGPTTTRARAADQAQGVARGGTRRRERARLRRSPMPRPPSARGRSRRSR